MDIVALILAIALEFGVPGNFVLAIAYEESGLNPNAVSSANSDGSRDWGLMQINDKWHCVENWQDAETNIRAGVAYIKLLSEREEITTWWYVAVAYNAGMGRINNPPASTLRYAERVMNRWQELEGVKYLCPIIRRRDEN